MKHVIARAMAGVLLALGAAAPAVALPNTSDTRMLTEPALSAHHLAFIYAGDVWLANADGSAPRRLTSDPGEKSNPVFSPDGKLLYYSKLGQTGLWAIPAQGGEERRILNDSVSDQNRNWTVSSDGIYFFDLKVAPNEPKLVKFYSFRTGKTSLAGTVEPTVSPDYSGISVSPDGRWLLYSHIASITSDLVLIDHFR